MARVRTGAHSATAPFIILFDPNNHANAAYTPTLLRKRRYRPSSRRTTQDELAPSHFPAPDAQDNHRTGSNWTGEEAQNMCLSGN